MILVHGILHMYSIGCSWRVGCSKSFPPFNKSKLINLSPCLPVHIEAYCVNTAL